MKRQDIICISMTTWEGNYMKTIVHMMNQLARNHRILFVDYPFTYKDLLMGFIGRGNAPVRRLIGLDKRLRKISSGDRSIFHLTLPPVFPTNWIQNTVKFKQQVSVQAETIRKSISQTMRELEIRNPLIINAFNPIAGLPLAGAFNESGLIYYCYDEIRSAEWCGKHGGKMEDEFIARVDSVIVTSEGLLKSKSKLHPDTTLIKNGVDFELFSRALNRFRFNKDRKVVGYIGSIDFRLDYDLLGSVIPLCPDFKFHFVGRIVDQHGFNQLKGFPNVYFSGPKQPDKIPEFMSEFDVGIIPFAMNEFNKNVYPLKINEYLAAGLPVVSTPFASLDEFNEHITLANSTDDFIQGIRDELVRDNLSLSNQRMNIAKANDWSARAEKVEEIISHRFEYAH